MKAVHFPQQNIVIAEHQKEYIPLPAHVTRQGVVVSCWEVEEADMLLIAERITEGRPLRFFVSQCTFHKPLQPLTVGIGFNPPILPEPEQPVEASVATPALPAASRLKLADIAQCKGLSGPMLWGMDTESRPGIAICHFVRVETQHLTHTKDFDATQFTALHPEADPRLLHLAECFQETPVVAPKSTKQLLQVIGLMGEALAQVKKTSILGPGTSKFVEDSLALGAQAIKAHA